MTLLSIEDLFITSEASARAIHIYWKIDPDLLWGIIENHLPELEKYVNNWLKQKEKELKENPPEKNQPRKESKLRRKLREQYPKDSRELYKIRGALTHQKSNPLTRFCLM